MSDTDTISTEQPTGEAAASTGATAADTAAADRGPANGTPTRRRAGLTGMVLAELRQLAGELNIPNTQGLRKGDLISAIKEAQGGGGAAKRPSRAAQEQLTLADESTSSSAPARNGARSADTSAPEAPPAGVPSSDAPSADAAPADAAPTRTRRRRSASRPAGAPEATPEVAGESAAPTERNAPTSGDVPRAADTSGSVEQRVESPDQEAGEGRARAARGGQEAGDGRGNRQQDGRDGGGNTRQQDRQDNRRPDNRDDRRQDSRDDRRQDSRDDRRPDSRDDRRPDSRDDRRQDNRDDDDDDGTGRGRRGRRFRDRNRRGRDRNDRGGSSSGGGSPSNDRADTEVRDDDVLLPVAGILDVLDNYAFVRTSGYLSGPNDVYVSLSMVRRYGLRRGDNVSGAVRQPRDGEQQRQKFNPLVRVDTINGFDPEQAKNRPEFTKLTPLYPNDRLRLETESSKLTTRVIDLVMPIGKGQRALIVSPPKAGKTMILQAIANAITTNNPECHLMVVLVDERPEEVTDMQRSVKGEVIASTFDRPPSDHTTVAELSIERAKRLVEMGHDVVVLLDSITRLGRAYNLAAPASGRILSGGVDSTALYPPKRFLGAARNIEDGGSLTIFATALVETGSTMDTVIFEEFKGTGNAELKLDRRIADKRVFPAIDIDASGTRKEELLLAPDEMAVTVKLRRVLSALDDQQALDLVLTQLRKTRTNIEFLMQVAKNTPSVDND
ncbi:transcription termination factor Rho [Pseudonocardia sp.]|uniref:transcription termination factor Rho n=1 Tax=Pseudonocardia sp. TaxID=60912 RepID=UPI0039C8F489